MATYEYNPAAAQPFTQSSEETYFKVFLVTCRQSEANPWGWFMRGIAPYSRKLGEEAWASGTPLFSETQKKTEESKIKFFK